MRETLGNIHSHLVDAKGHLLYKLNQLELKHDPRAKEVARTITPLLPHVEPFIYGAEVPTPLQLSASTGSWVETRRMIGEQLSQELWQHEDQWGDLSTELSIPLDWLSTEQIALILTPRIYRPGYTGEEKFQVQLVAKKGKNVYNYNHIRNIGWYMSKEKQIIDNKVAINIADHIVYSSDDVLQEVSKSGKFYLLHKGETDRDDVQQHSHASQLTPQQV